jgi:hypothetical protein
MLLLSRGKAIVVMERGNSCNNWKEVGFQIGKR